MTLERALVSGGAGFAGSHLVELLRAQGVEVVAPTRDELDLRDAERVRNAVAEARPSAFFHLAAFSSPSLSWQAPGEALLGNLEMTLNVLEAIRHEAPTATVILVGSGQVYGKPAGLPATEDTPFDPDNPYAVSKTGADILGRQYAVSHGMKVVRMRPFNHAGPGQSDQYVVSSLARQVAEAELGGRDECLLRTGNPAVARDFTDVRDVVRAYVLAAEIGSGAFNVCRGSATSVVELVGLVAAATQVAVIHEVDPTRLRANDTPVLYGSHERLTEACGWRPETPLARTVADTLQWWRGRLSA